MPGDVGDWDVTGGLADEVCCVGGAGAGCVVVKVVVYGLVDGVGDLEVASCGGATAEDSVGRLPQYERNC